MVVCGVERENGNLLRWCRDDLAEQLPLAYGTVQFGIEQNTERERDCGHAGCAWSDFHCVFHGMVLQDCKLGLVEEFVLAVLAQTGDSIFLKGDIITE